MYGVFGGDGGSPFDAYFGRDTPDFVVYTDGVAVRRITSGPSSYKYQPVFEFLTTQLKKSEICEFQLRVGGAVLPEYETSRAESTDHPLYNFDESALYGDGAPTYKVLLNGDPPIYLDINVLHRDYVIPELAVVLEFLEAYQLQAPSTFESNTILLWIEKGRWLAKEDVSPQPWPEALPSLESLFDAKVEGSWAFGASHAVLQGDIAKEVARVFDSQMKGMLFVDNDQLYYAIARPLLPHETVERYSKIPRPSDPQRLPFECSE